MPKCTQSACSQEALTGCVTPTDLIWNTTTTQWQLETTLWNA